MISCGGPYLEPCKDKGVGLLCILGRSTGGTSSFATPSLYVEYKARR